MKLRISTPVLATLLLATAFYTSTPEPADAPQEVPVVTISLDAEGNLTVSPDTVVVNRGQTVEWTTGPESAIESWRILFRSDVPFGVDAAVNGISGERGQRIGAALSNAAEVGRLYKYMVLARTGQRAYPPLDPEVEVGPNE